jgi:uncharacterized SAM-binding protein YcdF (DUF218 family)
VTPGEGVPDRAAPPRIFRLARGVLGVVLAAVASWLALLLMILGYGRLDGAEAADVIVVLGAAQYDGRPSPVLRARLDHAIALYHQGLAPLLITTGGVGAGDTVSEAVVGRRYAISAGVPPEAVLTERAGMRTVASMEGVARLMRGRQLRSAVLVSDPFHSFRLRLISAQLGIRARTSPTRTSPISRDRATELRHAIRESGIIVFMILPGDP